MKDTSDRTSKYQADSLSLIGAVALGTGVMIGAGIFALTGQMAEMTGSLFPLAFLSAALIVSFSAYSYVKLSNAYPSAGGIAMYLEKAYGGTLTTAFHALLMYFSMVIAQSFLARTASAYFIRHGETEWSRSGQYTGRTDIPLTAHGEDEARKVGQRLRDIPFAHVLTSPLQRAQQTCALAALGPTPRIEPDLAEWDNGDDEGRTSAEILKLRPDWNLFRDGSPRGETPAQISARADRFIAQVRALGGNVALFSHSHFGRVLAARWIGLPAEQAQHFLLSTASVSVLCYEHDRTDQPAIALWNSAASETFDPAPNQDAGETRPMKRRAIDRWENEGGEIPNVPIPQPGPQCSAGEFQDGLVRLKTQEHPT